MARYAQPPRYGSRLGAALGLAAILIGVACLIIAGVFEAMSVMTATLSGLAIVFGALAVTMYFWSWPKPRRS